MSYNFATLSPIEFEALARDLVGREIGLRFEAFTEGRDGGIDGRYTASEDTIILQAKHYHKSGFNSLKSTMKKERSIIDKLEPTRYILVTSASLTSKNKSALQEIVGPSLIDVSDIFGPDDLNALLRKFSDIERAHPSLWRYSATVLKTLLHEAIEGEGRANSTAEPLSGKKNQQLSLKIASALRPIKVANMSAADRLDAIGRRVTWTKLAAGAYMPRQSATENVLSEIERWFAGFPIGRNIDFLPVFWIDGRSGDGKSVFILQVANLLISKHPNIITFHVSNPESLPEVLESFSNTAPLESTVLFIVDDIYKIVDLKRWEYEVSSILDHVSMRFLCITCGSTPLRENFSEKVLVTSVISMPCPSFSEDEIVELAQWFDKEPTYSDRSSSKILIERIIEMNGVESIGLFSHSFLSNLTQLGLGNAARLAIFMNMLDLPAPMCLIDGPDNRSQLYRLSKNDQNHFDVFDYNGIECFRIVHRKIAPILVDSWFKIRRDGESSVDILASIFLEILQRIGNNVNTGFLFDVLRSVVPSLRDEGYLNVKSSARFLQRLVSDNKLEPNLIWILHQTLIYELGCIQNSDQKVNSSFVNQTLELIEGESTSYYGIFSLAITILVSPIASSREKEIAIMYAKKLLSKSLAAEDASNFVAFLISHYGDEYKEEVVTWFDTIDVNTSSIRRYRYRNAFEAFFAHSADDDKVAEFAVRWFGGAVDNDGSHNILSALVSRIKNKKIYIDLAVMWIRKWGASRKTKHVLLAILPQQEYVENLDDIITWWVDRASNPSDCRDVLFRYLSTGSRSWDIVKRLTTKYVLYGDETRFTELIGLVVRQCEGRREIIGFGEDWLIYKEQFRLESQNLAIEILKNEPFNKVAVSFLKSMVTSESEASTKKAVWIAWIKADKTGAAFRFLARFIFDAEGRKIYKIDEYLIRSVFSNCITEFCEYICKFGNEKSGRQLLSLLDSISPESLAISVGPSLIGMHRDWPDFAKIELWAYIIRDPFMKADRCIRIFEHFWLGLDGAERNRLKEVIANRRDWSFEVGKLFL